MRGFLVRLLLSCMATSLMHAESFPGSSPSNLTVQPCSLALSTTITTVAGSTIFHESNVSKNPSSNAVSIDTSLFNLQSISNSSSRTGLDAAVHPSTSSSTSRRNIDELVKSAMSTAFAPSSLPTSSSASTGETAMTGSAPPTNLRTSALGGTVSMTRVITMMLTSPSSSVSRPHLIEIRNNASFLALPNQAVPLGDLVMFDFLEYGLSFEFHFIDGNSVDDGVGSSVVGRAIYSAGIHVNGMSPVNVDNGPFGSIRSLTAGTTVGIPSAQLDSSALGVTHVPTPMLSEGSKSLHWSWIPFLAFAYHLILLEWCLRIGSRIRIGFGS